MNKASLLSQLQIDRDARASDPEGGVPWLTILHAVVAVALLAAAAWFLVVRPDRPAVRVAEAKSTAQAGGAAGGSLLDASGYVIARRAATVSSKITGKVAEVLIEEGRRVEADQVLARLDDSNARAALAQADAQVSAADANLSVARVAFEQAGPRDARRQKMHASGYLSDQSAEDSRNALETARYQYDAARRQADVARAARELARRNLEDTVVRAPFAGVVTVKAAQPGEMVSPVSAGGGFTRTGIGTIVDMESLEVEVDVAESFINRVRQGMPAVVRLNAYPDWEIPAEVIAVIPTANRAKATVAVRVGMKSRDPRIVPEMGARVSFLAPREATAPGARNRNVVVPAAAVQPAGRDTGVVFVVAGGKLERRVVRLGAVDPQGQTLQSGVGPGDRVVVGDLGNLKDGQRVRIDRSPPSGDDEQN